jgi:uncharacterized NAD(P)/FAD-binding protein YdhS
VVGAGASGAATVIQLATSPTPTDITVIDPDGCRWRGAAYTSTAEHHTVNIPRVAMSILGTGSAADFDGWVAEQVRRGQLDPKWVTPQHTHLPRGVYGSYIAERTAAAINAAQGTVSLRTDAVVSITPDGAGHAAGPTAHGTTVTARLASGGAVADVDFVVLCIGNLAPTVLPALEGVCRSKHFVGNPWRFPAVGAGASVALIGSRLTAVDVVAHLQHACSHTGPLHVVSRTGLLPHANVGERLSSPYTATDFLGPAPHALPLAELSDRVRRECQKFCGAAGEGTATGDDAAAERAPATWHSVIDCVRPHTNAIWAAMSDDDKATFVTTGLRDEWEIRRHRVAPGQLDPLHRRVADGSCRHVIGSIRGASLIDGGKRIRLEVQEAALGDDGGVPCTAIDVDYVINCTGPSLDYRVTRHPLIVALREAGLIVPEPHGVALLLADTATGAVLQHEQPASPIVASSAGCKHKGFEASAWLHAIGPPRKGTEWETIAIADISRQAVDVAAAIGAKCTQ